MINDKQFLEDIESNDNTKLKKLREEFCSDSETTNFSLFIGNKMKEQVKFDHIITRLELANILGYSGTKASNIAEILKKTINTTGYTTNRDRIIMIAIGLCLTVIETNHALLLYKMIPLDENDLRERIIILSLRQNINIKKTNEWLSKVNQPVLSFEPRKSVNKYAQTFQLTKKATYTVLSPCEVHIGDFVGDTSISGMYNPYNYMIEAEMTIQNLKGKQLILKTDYNKGFYEINDPLIIGIHSSKYFSSIDEITDMEIQNFFQNMDIHIANKYRYFLQIIDDTRNYQQRLDIDVINGNLTSFIEMFNYAVPEECEYFQLIQNGNDLMFTVTHRSSFLSHHLGKHYSDFYLNKDISIAEEYPSLSSIDESNLPSYKKQLRKDAYITLQSSLHSTYSKIKEQKILVCDPYTFTEDWYDLAKFFGLQEFFTWSIKDKSGMQYAEINSCTYLDDAGLSHQIELLELKEAVSLGIFNLKDLFTIKSNYNNLSDIFK